MHSSLWIFNSDHDMALAINSPYYMPPMNVKKMINDLSFLPAWYANDKSSDVLVSYAIYKSLKENPFPIMPNVGYVYDFDYIYNKVYSWGWNRALCNFLHNKKEYIKAIPTDDELLDIRALSSRKITTELLPNLIINKNFIGESHCAFSLEEVVSFLNDRKSIAVKAPWSGSGRGVRFIKESMLFQDERWISRIISSQGYVIVEPLYNKVLDFAMEFYCDKDSNVDFIGYSMFETDAMGAYKENVLASNKMIEQTITSYVSLENINDIMMSLKTELSRILIGKYEGYLGVDMMVCKDSDDKFLIHPCVEINLRMNMGIVSRIFYDRYIQDGMKGRFVVDYYKEDESAVKTDKLFKEKYPLRIENDRILSGYFSLTPILKDTRYQIYVIL